MHATRRLWVIRASGVLVCGTGILAYRAVGRPDLLLVGLGAGMIGYAGTRDAREKRRDSDSN